MKTAKALLILAASFSSVLADKVSLQHLPLAAQQAIRSRAGNNPITDIERIPRGDQITYEAIWRSGLSEQRLLVSEAGTILRDALAPAAGPAASLLTLANKSAIALTEAPPAVQKAIQNEVHGAGVELVEKGNWNGQVVYQAAYTRDGQQALFQVNELGQPLVSKITVPPFQPRYAGLAALNVPLGGAAQTPYYAAPEAVKETVNYFAGGNPIESFERGNWKGKTVYAASFRKNGEPIQLQILEDGTVLTPRPAGAAIPSPLPETAAGAPASPAATAGQQQP
jgi:hypothetical protein